MPLGERCSSREITLSNKCEWRTTTCWLNGDGECRGNALCSGKNETTCEETQYGYCSPQIGTGSGYEICEPLQNEAACEGQEAFNVTMACELKNKDQQPKCWHGSHTASFNLYTNLYTHTHAHARAQAHFSNCKHTSSTRQDTSSTHQAHS